MLECPACNRSFDVDVELLNAHVASHYGDGEDPLAGTLGSEIGLISSNAEDATQSGFKRKRSDQELSSKGDSLSIGLAKPPAGEVEKFECLVCGTALEYHSVEEKQIHVNACLDSNEDDGNDSWSGVSGPRDGQTDAQIDTITEKSLRKGRIPQLGNGTWKAGDPRQKGDLWWSPVDCSVDRLPMNFSPGLTPVLKRILSAAHSQGITRRAVLCTEGVCHIKNSMGFDSGWGCGYRNLEMALSALLVAAPHYRPAFPLADPAGKSDSPGVRNLQVWMQQAWDAGFDVQGRNQLQGKIVGTKKWIGTSDIYAAMVARGVPCYLHDFPKPTGAKWHSTTATHSALTAYVQKYFDHDDQVPATDQVEQSKTAFDNLMDRQSSTAVRISSRLPLILQHSGHSRTIVGYEINAQGNTNLLLFDPGSSIPKDVRRDAIEGWKSSAASSLDAELQLEEHVDAGPITCEPDQVQSDEEMNAKGWVRKKVDKVKGKGKGKNSLRGNSETHRPEWETKPVKALNAFRVNLGALSKNQEYQILRFTGGPLMTVEERRQYRLIRAERMT